MSWNSTEEAVEAQGKVVRELKEGERLDNNADPVKKAVAELLSRKDKLEAMKDRFELAQNSSES